jgi:hypothetical protein
MPFGTKRRIGHHQRRIRYALIAGDGGATTSELLFYCFPQADGEYRHSMRWAMYRAAKRFAIRIGRAEWSACPELLRQIRGD